MSQVASAFTSDRRPIPPSTARPPATNNQQPATYNQPPVPLVKSADSDYITFGKLRRPFLGPQMALVRYSLGIDSDISRGIDNVSL